MSESKTVREFLSDSKVWTKGAMARNESGWAVGVNSESAVCFCLLGAVRKVYGLGDTFNEAMHSLRLAIVKLQPIGALGVPVDNISISLFNDNPETTFEDVRRVLDEAKI